MLEIASRIHNAIEMMAGVRRGGVVARSTAMSRPLKVFRTPIGFHDAYVAAPSRKAALEAWGSDVDLFARGLAEPVTDADLVREPLAHPGEVIRRRRGSDDDHFAELDRQAPKPHRRPAKPAAERKPVRPAKAEPRNPPKPPNPKPRRPAPSRAALEAAEAALERRRVEQKEAIAALRQRERSLQEQRRALESEQEREIARLDAAIAKARGRYAEALAKWRG
jgi:hypothetical protein